jgi:hypothetical protein
LSKKKVIILFSITVFLILIQLFTASNSKQRVEAIGHELIQIKKITDWRSNNNSPIDDIVNIGPDLYKVISSSKVKKENITVTSNYAGVLGLWPTILIETNNSELLIKLRYDFWLMKYHITGFTGTIE